MKLSQGSKTNISVLRSRDIAGSRNRLCGNGQNNSHERPHNIRKTHLINHHDDTILGFYLFLISS